MANPRMTLLDLLNKAEQGADAEFLRDGLELLAQELMDVEVTQLIGASPHERSKTRLTYRNGYREREWDTRVGTIELDIPNLRAGSYLPSLLEPRRRHEKALLSVVQEAYIQGLSTRDVDALAEALRCVSRIRRATVTPSNPGSLRSSMTRSGRAFSTLRTAVSPSCATWTVCPSDSSDLASASHNSHSSSTTRILAIASRC
jgi:transposase-like protein